MKSKLRLVAAPLGRRGVGGLKKFAPKFSSLVDRQARKVRNFMLTARIMRVILLEEVKNMNVWDTPPLVVQRYVKGDLVNVSANYYDTRSPMVAAVVMKASSHRDWLYTVYYKGKIWPNIHQDEMSPCRLEKDP